MSNHGLLSLVSRATTVASPGGGSMTRFGVARSAVGTVGSARGVAVSMVAANPRHTIAGSNLPIARSGHGNLERGDPCANTVDLARTCDTSRSSSSRSSSSFTRLHLSRRLKRRRFDSTDAWPGGACTKRCSTPGARRSQGDRLISIARPNDTSTRSCWSQLGPRSPRSMSSFH
jgi:hypothetical protein